MGQAFSETAYPVIFVNGKRHELRSLDCRQTLAAWLRSTLGLTGTKLGCGTGVCGACTVMVSRVEQGGRVSHRAINACLVPVTYADHAHVTTVEGSDAILREVQARFANGFASQVAHFCAAVSVPPSLAPAVRLLQPRHDHVIVCGATQQPQRHQRGGTLCLVVVVPTFHSPHNKDLQMAIDGNLCRCTGRRGPSARALVWPHRLSRVQGHPRRGALAGL